MRRLVKKYGKYVIWAVTISFLLGALIIFTPGKFNIAQRQSREAKEPALIVNGEKITKGEFDEAYQNLINYYRRLYAQNRLGSFDAQLQGPSGAVYQLKLKSDVLEDLVRQAILRQQAKELGIKITKKDIEKEIDNWVEREYQYVLDYYGMTEEELKERLEQEGMTLEKFKQSIREEIEGRRDQIERQLLEDRIRAKVVGTIEPTEEELKKYFEDHKYKYATPEMVRARHILIKVAEDATEEEVAQARARIEEIKRKLDEGADFAELAKEYSEDEATADKGGDLGWFQRGQMVKEFEEAAFALQPGQISDIIRTKYGFHIIKLEDRRPGKGYEDVKDQVRRDYIDEQKRQKFDDWYKELRDVAEVKIELPVLRAYMLEEKDKDEALAAYEALAQEGKVKDPYLHYYIARIYEEKLDEAKRTLGEEQKQEQPDEEKIRELEAQIADYTEKVKENLYRTLDAAGEDRELFDELILYDDENPDLHYRYGKYLRGIGRYDDAKKQLDRALELNPQHTGALILYGDLMMEEKKHDEAIQRYEEALALIENDPNLTRSVQTKLGQAYLKQENYDKAEELFAKVLEADPENQQVLALMGDVLFAKGEYAKAVEHYDKALKVGGRKPEIQVKLGNAYLKAGQLQEAADTFNDVIQQQSFYAADAYLGLGDVHKAEGLTDQALEDYKEGFRRSQYRTQLREQLGERILELDPNDVETRFDLARTYQRAHEWEQAIAHYKTLLEQKPEMLEAYQGLAECYEGQEDYAQAIVTYEQAIAVTEDANQKINFYKRILSDDEKLVGEGEKLDEHGLEALLQLAKLYLGQDKKDEAKAQLERLKEENPDYKPDEVAALWAELQPSEVQTPSEQPEHPEQPEQPEPEG